MGNGNASLCSATPLLASACDGNERIQASKETTLPLPACSSSKGLQPRGGRRRGGLDSCRQESSVEGPTPRSEEESPLPPAGHRKKHDRCEDVGLILPPALQALDQIPAVRTGIQQNECHALERGRVMSVAVSVEETRADFLVTLTHIRNLSSTLTLRSTYDENSQEAPRTFSLPLGNVLEIRYVEGTEASLAVSFGDGPKPQFSFVSDQERDHFALWLSLAAKEARRFRRKRWKKFDPKLPAALRQLERHRAEAQVQHQNAGVALPPPPQQKESGSPKQPRGFSEDWFDGSSGTVQDHSEASCSTAESETCTGDRGTKNLRKSYACRASQKSPCWQASSETSVLHA